MYYDFRFKFLVVDLERAMTAFDWLRARGLLGAEELPTNQLGWVQGRASSTVVDPETGVESVSAAAGDPAYFYVHVRTREVTPSDLAGLDLASCGLVPIGAAEAEAVLGAWA